MSVESGPAGARSYGLGKGLAALLGESAHTGRDAEAGDGLPRTLALDLLEPNPQQVDPKPSKHNDNNTQYAPDGKSQLPYGIGHSGVKKNSAPEDYE